MIRPPRKLGLGKAPLLVGALIICLAVVSDGWPSALSAVGERPTPKPNLAPGTSGAPTPPVPTSDAKQQERTAVDDVVKVLKAVQDFVAALVNTIRWPVVALILLLVSRNRLLPSLQSLLVTIRERGGTLKAGVLELQVGAALETRVDLTTFFSRSPLDIEEDVTRDRSGLVGDLGPQLDLPMDDSVAQGWKNGSAAAEAAAQAMVSAREALERACANATSLAQVRRELLTYARHLETARFLDALALFDLMSRRSFLRAGVEQIQPGPLPATKDDCLILHCAAVAYGYAASMQNAEWQRATALLDKLVWQGTAPHYLPAAATWLACAYGKCLETSKNLDVDSPQVFSTIERLLERGAQLYEAMQTADWTAFGTAPANTVYHKRELLKVRGSIASVLGEVSRDSAQKDSYFRLATDALVECASTINGEPSAPLDHNNLADLYRQLGDYRRDLTWYDRAHTELDRAVQGNANPDPIFYNTRAFIYWRQSAPFKGFLVLQEYSEDRARGAAIPELAQYVDNQIFAARLATAATSEHRAGGLALAATILEPVRRILDHRRAATDGATPNARALDELRAKVDELLAVIYLELPGHQLQAVEAYDRLRAGNESKPGSEALWRRDVGRARALTGVSALERQRFSSEVARQYRRRAHGVLAPASTQVETFALDPGKFPPLQVSRHFLLRLDTVLALQDLAQESFLQGAPSEARELLDQKGKILLSLRAALGRDGAPPPPLDRTVVGELARSEARRSFLLARLRIQADLEFNDPGLIAAVETELNGARSDDENLNCRIDLQRGHFLMAAALAGRGDTALLADRALAALERAATRNAPALRAVAVRALADGAFWHATALRRAQEVAKSAKSK